MMVFVRLGPITAMIRMASTSAGMASSMSMTREMTTSTRFDDAAASRPSVTPSTSDTLITARPMNSDTRAPKMMRDSMSRPTSSVPRMNRQEPSGYQTGGAFTASRNCSIGL